MIWHGRPDALKPRLAPPRPLDCAGGPCKNDHDLGNAPPGTEDDVEVLAVLFADRTCRRRIQGLLDTGFEMFQPCRQPVVQHIRLVDRQVVRIRMQDGLHPLSPFPDILEQFLNEHFRLRQVACDA